MIYLKEITRKNYMNCITLKSAKHQIGFTASNAFSLAQASFCPECTPLAIYDDELMVGFIMHCIDQYDDNNWIYRLMIDEKYQRKGYAQQAMKLIIDKLKKDTTRNKILISYVPGNKEAESLYKKLGFIHTGGYVDDEIIMQLKY